VKAGDLRHRVLFETAVDTVDDTTGEPIRTWQSLGYAMSRVEPLRGRELLVDGGIRDDLDTRIVTRYSPELAAMRAKDRATFAGVYYNIAAVIHVGSNQREIQFMCKSGLNDG
jgi:SPP1 family predicted phage head-tail adaptor